MRLHDLRERTMLFTILATQNSGTQESARMSQKLKQYDQITPHQGPDHAAPYPVSRMAPTIELVDLAQEIASADQMLGNLATAKLRTIADQMRALQAQARQVMAQVQQDQLLHRAQCNFQRHPGRIYHLYRKSAEQTYFSMLSPEEWRGAPPHEFLGSYRLEADMSWTPADQIDDGDDSRAYIQRFLLPGGD